MVTCSFIIMITIFYIHFFSCCIRIFTILVFGQFLLWFINVVSRRPVYRQPATSTTLLMVFFFYFGQWVLFCILSFQIWIVNWSQSNITVLCYRYDTSMMKNMCSYSAATRTYNWRRVVQRLEIFIFCGQHMQGNICIFEKSCVAS